MKKKVRHLFSAFVLPATVLCAFSACHDDSEVFNVEPPSITLSETRVEIGCDGRYYRIEVVAESASNVRVSTDATWLQLDADTLPASGSLQFYVEPNNGVRSRETLISLYSEDGTIDATVTVHQRSMAEDDENAIYGDSISRRARVGYGYNMLIEFMNPKSVTEPILDYGRLVAAEQAWGTVIAEEGRSRQELSVHCSYSIEEMSSWLSQQQTTQTNILFSNKTVQKFNQVAEYELGQQTFGYSSLSKVVSTRYVDEGKLESILRNGNNVFTDDFKQIYDQVNSSPTVDNVKRLVCKYGTHLIVYADLGGRLDYMVNFKSRETSKESVEKYLKYKNGSLKEDNEVSETSHSICNNGGLTFDIYGGSDEAVNRLQTDAMTADRYGQVDSGMLGEWLNSVTTKNSSSLSIVGCRLMPIWQLFTNVQARTQIINHIISLSRSEGGDIGARLQEMSLDNYYRFDITSNMLEFNNGAGTTLVRVGRFDNQPKVEICNEYVPEIRADRRVTVIYPIYNGQTNIRRGIFPGDGNNPPSEVMYDDAGGCYVVPIDGCNAGDRITSLYYIDGAFYTTNLGIDIPYVKMSLKDEWMNFKGDNDYPIVKIGPGYWTRNNIKDSMEFGEPVDADDPECEDYYIYEEIIDGMLYANIFYGNSVAFRFNYPGVFDDETDYSGNRIHWYVPRVVDIRTLEKYVGNNCKALFSGRQSGFEAQFAGYYGNYDDLNGGTYFGDNRLRYVGEYSFIASKETMKNSGEVLVLAQDYTLKRCSINQTRDNWYPVRPYRSSHYKYQ